MNWYYLILLLIISSCSSNQPSLIQKKDANLYWNILDNVSAKIWTKDKIKKIWGEPREIFHDQKQEHRESWIYDHPTEDYQEWTFGFDANDYLTFVKYFPASDFYSEFSLNNLEKHWLPFHCEHKTKQVLHPHVIKNLTYLSCDHQKRQVEYNKYKEVFSITIEQ